MKLAIAKEHRHFFEKEGLIEFEGVLTQEQLLALDRAIDQALALRTGVPSERWKHLTAEQLFLNGRDLWRSYEPLRQFICQPRFGQIASDLLDKKPLRLGFDQFLPVRPPDPSSKSIYADFLSQQLSLEEVSCLSGVLCGLMIGLSGKRETSGEEIEVQEKNEKDIFPREPGSVVFFQPQTIFNWQTIYQHIGQRFYLIVYTQALSHYLLQPRDPHTHALKQLGYVFNDKLLDRLNPIVYR